MKPSRLLRTVLIVLSLVPAGAGRAADAPVTIAVHARVDGETLRIRGEATVPDDAWITFAAYSVAAPRMRSTGYTRVRDGRFAAEAGITNWPPGEIAVDAHFQMLLPGHAQPDAAVTRFGRRGEHMVGENVVQGGDSYRFAVASTTTHKP